MRKLAEKERESLVDHYCPPSEDLEVCPAEYHGERTLCSFKVFIERLLRLCVGHLTQLITAFVLLSARWGAWLRGCGERVEAIGWVAVCGHIHPLISWWRWSERNGAYSIRMNWHRTGTDDSCFRLLILPFNVSECCCFFLYTIIYPCCSNTPVWQGTVESFLQIT